ncbi:hypothetical protein [Magnetofaba australis]|uniref:Uncharacterized protein n=1 Tax=Magnetofaba australis IT-1 TaxID=1434232 RepID=A0A1Y2K7X6_9PROT|nr:hypothetical protein [Magnetofaba australis]OSM04885.1 hypothetical protein MAIT1_02988 [Magnetofaba australis IT-1]
MKVEKIWFQEKRLVPQLQPNVDESVKKRLRLLRKAMLTALTRQRFVTFSKQRLFYYDNQLNCLWLVYQFHGRPDEMFRYVSKLRVYAFNHWEVPDIDQLRSIAREPLFLERINLKKDATVLSSTPSTDGLGYQTVTLGHIGQSGASQEMQTIIPVHRVSQRDIFGFIVANSLIPDGIEGVEDKLQDLYDLTVEMSAKSDPNAAPSINALQHALLESDFVRARLPVVESAALTDMGKGLWELYHTKAPSGAGWRQVELPEAWEARNPEQDVRDGVVAIDFGTSSTVVACREHGKTSLLRVGMTDFFQKPTPQDYQNPTVLQFINLPGLLSAWNSEAYQPLTRWDDFHFSHQALEELRANAADQQVVGSVLTAIKQWPLRAEDPSAPLRITDQTSGYDLTIHPGIAPMPAPQQAITVSEDDPFDPIELYAYYLGLFINHRANGLFLEYYMTFPITYPREAKHRILSAFARGLQRSLPLSLIGSPSMHRFSVREEASEPAAYAACALTELHVEPTDKGAAYAVFDFGGGTTDFDFGIYRLPNAEQEEQGYEHVIKHFGASGDVYLGGENLVAHLAYQTFLQNLEGCREHKIPFTCPMEAEMFPGHELFVESSHVAQTNTALVMGAVRKFWEDFQWDLTDEALAQKVSTTDGKQRNRRRTDLIGDAISQAIVSVDFDIDPKTQSLFAENQYAEFDLELLDRDKQKVAVHFKVDRNQLNLYLTQRVGKGILRFFIALKEAFEARDHHPEEVHILQAGNSCRSLLVQALFTTFLQSKMMRWEPPPSGGPRNPVLEEIQKAAPFLRFIVHRPPMGDPNNPYKPTAKTGVAIGLLKLIPGEPLLALGPNDETAQGEAPFRLFVGSYKKSKFTPALKQNSPYAEWRELGAPTRGVFNLVYTTSPQGGIGGLERGSQELMEYALRFDPGVEGKKVFVRALSPYQVETCLAEDLAQILKRPEEITYQQTLSLRSI